MNSDHYCEAVYAGVVADKMRIVLAMILDRCF
jgi:hypothetical protein